MTPTSDASRLDTKSHLVMTDYHIGLLAQVDEYRFRVQRAERRLETEMTRAYQAEVALDEARLKLARLNSLQNQLDDMRRSLTWRLGKLLMTPVRVLRRLVRQRG